MKYKFTGDYPETFLELGRELQPGETFESGKVIEHPRLTVVEDKPPKAQIQTRAEVNE